MNMTMTTTDTNTVASNIIGRTIVNAELVSNGDEDVLRITFEDGSVATISHELYSDDDFGAYSNLTSSFSQNEIWEGQGATVVHEGMLNPYTVQYHYIDNNRRFVVVSPDSVFEVDGTHMFKSRVSGKMLTFRLDGDRWVQIEKNHKTSRWNKVKDPHDLYIGFRRYNAYQ